MSDNEAAEGKPAGAAGPSPSEGAPGVPGGKSGVPGGKKGRFIPGAAIAAIGAAITVGIVAATIVITPKGIGSGTEPSLTLLPQNEIAAAAPSLDPAVAEKAVADAKACKVPLARVTLVKRPGSVPGVVRIRSGSYLSPPFLVTDSRQSVAIPYPAPYPTGRGVLSLVGETKDVWFYLTPGWFVPDLNGNASINVWWRTDKPC